jgi:hypothetical protein
MAVVAAMSDPVAIVRRCSFPCRPVHLIKVALVHRLVGGPERRQLTTGTQLLPIERDQLEAAQSAGPTQREKGGTVGRSLSRSLRSSSPMIGCALRAISIFAFVLQMPYHVTLGPFFYADDGCDLLDCLHDVRTKVKGSERLLLMNP